MYATSNLSGQSMLSASAAWVDPNRYRPQLEQFVEMRGPLVVMDRARQQLIDTQQDEGDVDGRIEKLTNQIAALDRRHDRKARALYSLLTGLAERADDPKVRDKWLGYRTKLFPADLSFNTSSYMDEAGNVVQVRARVTPKLRKTFEETVVDDEPLLTTLVEWLDAGDDLGEAVNERASLRNGGDDTRISAGDVLQARYFWMNACDGFVKYLHICDIDDKTRQKILGPLEEALRNVGKSQDAPADEDADPVDDDNDVVVDNEDVVVEDAVDDNEDEDVVDADVVEEPV